MDRAGREACELQTRTDAEHRHSLIEYLENYIIMDDVSLEDVTDTSAAIAVEGPLASELTAGEEGLMIAASTLCAAEGVWILTDAGAKSTLVSELESKGIPRATEPDILLARVENHRAGVLDIAWVGRDR